jgi:hypothetical protein
MMVWIAPHLRWEIKGDTESRNPLLQEKVVPSIGISGRSKT